MLVAFGRLQIVRLAVVVPTHERPDVLAGCLASLQAQTAPVGQVEVLVIDDGSKSDIGAVVEAATARGPLKIRCDRQELSGLNTARNRGVSGTTAEVVAFIDDDTLLAPEWATALLDAFRSENCAAVGGRTTLAVEGAEPAWVAEWRYYLAEYDLGELRRPLEPGDPMPVGANCAVRREIFFSAGGFRPGLDRIGSSLVSNGDTEFFRRLRRKGHGLFYVGDAHAVHRVPRSRLTLEYFRRRHRAQGVSDELILRSEGHAASLGHRVGLSREVARAAWRYGAAELRGRSAERERLLLGYWSSRLAATRLTLEPPGDAPTPGVRAT